MEKTMGTDEHDRPRGFVAIGVFFVFGATMAAYAAATLLKPRTVLDRLWVLNKPGHAQLASLGKGVALGFVVLSALLCAAAVGWFRRRYWGWVPGNDDHCDQRGGRSNQCCEGRVAERRRGSGDRGRAV